MWVKVWVNFDDLFDHCNQQGIDCLNAIREAGKEAELMARLEEDYSADSDIDDITDWLCYEWDDVLETLGIPYHVEGGEVIVGSYSRE